MNEVPYHGEVAVKRIASVFLLIIAASVSSYADDYTWNGNAGNSNWNDPGNWTGGPSFPGSSNSTDDTAIIPSDGTIQHLPQLNVTVELSSLDIKRSDIALANSGAHALVINTSIGGRLNFSGGASITLESTDPQKSPISLISNTEITVTGAGRLDINSQVRGIIIPNEPPPDLSLTFDNGFDTDNANTSIGPDIARFTFTSRSATEAVLPEINIGSTLTISAANDIRQAGGANIDAWDFVVSTGTTYSLTNQTVTAKGSITDGGTINVSDTATVTAYDDFTIANIVVGDVNGNATFRVGGNFTPVSFIPGDNIDTTDTDSTVEFFSDLRDSVANAQSFHNLTINDPGNEVSASGSWRVYGVLTMTAGTFKPGSDRSGNIYQHEIWRNWDSTSPNIILDAVYSDFSFKGGMNTTIRTKEDQSLYRLEIDKDTAAAVTLVSSLKIAENLTIRRGFLYGGTANEAQDIEIGGNWTDAPGVDTSGFRHRNGEVTFVPSIDGSGSIFTVNYLLTSPSFYFYDLEIRDSELSIEDILVFGGNLTIGNDLTIHGKTTARDASVVTDQTTTVNGNVLINAEAANASLTTREEFTANAATKSVTLQQAGTHEAKIDFTDQNFQIGALNNGGELRLRGSQATQGFPTAAAKENYGLITYYGHATRESRIRHDEFWNLSIDAPGRSILMNNDITVFGRSDPNGNKELTNDPGPASHTDLNGLRILNGTLNAESGGSQYDIKLHGMMYVSDSGSYNWGTTANIGSGGATVEFKGPYPAYIGGDITFFRFLVNSGADAGAPVAPGEPVDSTVSGKHFYFQEGKTITIADHVDARFIVVGDDVSPDDGVPDDSWIALHSGASGTRWMISKPQSVNVTMKYVYVQASNATPREIRSPAKVWTSDCINWVGGVPYIELSSTRDQLNNFTGAVAMMNNTPYQPNGRIDRILVEVSTDINSDFSGLEVEVEGYEVLGFDSGNDATDHETLNSRQFWIILKEGNALDTGATPSWRLVRNTTLGSASGPERVSMTPSKDKEIPYDGAPPLVGYTLAVVDSERKEVFVHFSEPVVNTADGDEIKLANFATTVGGGVASIERVSTGPSNKGTREVVLKLDSSVTANDVTGNARNLTFSEMRDIPTPKSAHELDEGDRSDTASSLPSFSTSHRISDIALGIVGNGIVQPKSARGEQQTSADSFDGRDALWAGDIELEAHRYTGQTLTPIIYWRNAREIDQSYKNNGLWLPYFEEIANSGNRPFFGLVPRPLSTGLSPRDMRSVSGDEFEHKWDSTDESIVNGSDLDFLFRVDGRSTTNHLYAARCEDDSAANWYRRIRPWSIKIRNTVNQAGAVSIQNNIINPKNNEKTTLQYQLSSRGTVTIQVFDLSGNTVEVLQRGSQSPGSYTVSWDGRNHAGNVVARGIYFIRFVGPDNIDQIRKVLVVK